MTVSTASVTDYRQRISTAIATAVAYDVHAHRFSYASEDDLQAALALLLTGRGFSVEREVRLTARDRIDLLVGRVGIEVKVASAPRAVLRQLTRYAASDLIDELLLVTTMARHALLPNAIDGVPVTVVELIGAGL